MPRRVCGRRSRRFRRRRYAPGARGSARRPSSDRADGCFHKAMKSSPLLRAWLRRLGGEGVAFELRHHWRGWDDDGRLLFTTPRGRRGGRCGRRRAGAGRSELAAARLRWRLGRGARQGGIGIAPLRPANCGFVVHWSDVFRSRFEGQPLKRIELSFGGRTVRGEALITQTGLEGGGIYALSGALRDAIAASGEAILAIDLRPDLTQASWSGGSARRAGSNRSPRSCARPRSCRRRRSDCCERQTPRRRHHQRCGASPPASRRCGSASAASRRSRAPSRAPAASHSTRSTRISCCAAAPARSLPARCWTGRRRPGATCCKPVRHGRGRRQRGVDVAWPHVNEN